MAKKKIRIGLIGCGGNMRGAHMRRLKADGAVELVAVVDVVEMNAHMLLENWGTPAPYYSDYKQMLRREELDGVWISSPHAHHFPQARMALERGAHVLVEKPLTISGNHSKNLIELAAKRKRFLVVAYQRHFLPTYVYARELVQKGKLGEIRSVIGYVTQDWGKAGKWRHVPELAGGGMFMDTGSHLTAAALWVTGVEPTKVSAYVDNRDKPVDLDTVLSAVCENGAQLSLSYVGCTPRHDERLAIHGSEGVLVLQKHQWQVGQPFLNGEPLSIPARIKDDTPDAALLRWIRNGGRGYEPPTYALHVARLGDAVYKAAKQKKSVRVR